MRSLLRPLVCQWSGVREGNCQYRVDVQHPLPTDEHCAESSQVVVPTVQRAQL